MGERKIRLLTIEDTGSDMRVHFAGDDSTYGSVIVTSEGIIIDVYDLATGECLETFGGTFSELLE